MDLTRSETFLLMLEDNANARSPFKATDLVWTNLSRIFRDRLAKEGVARVDSFNSSFASYPRKDIRYRRFATHLGDPSGLYDRACELYYNRLKARDAHGVLSKTDLSRAGIDSGMATDVGGKLVTWDYLLSVDEVITLVELEPRLLTDTLTIVDLGAGWGRVGSVLAQLNPQLAYVVVDIPESLFIAQEHLPLHLPDVPVHPYSKNRTIARFDRDTLVPGIRFCGTQDLDRFADASVDVFINLFSFQEMTMQQTAEYFDIVDRVAKGGLLFTQQRLVGDVMTRENYPYLPGWSKLFDRPTIFSPTYFEAAFRI